MNIKDAIKEFITVKRSMGCSFRTVDYYSDSLNMFLDYTGNIDVRHLTSSTFLNYQAFLIETHPNTRKTSLQTYARATKVFMRYLCENNYVKIDRQKLILLKTERSNIFPLSDYETSMLLSGFDDLSFHGLRNKLICLLMLDSGLRRGEVVSLKKNNILISNKIMKVVGKGSKERLLPFGATTCKYIKQFMAISNEYCEYLIQNRFGEPITENTIKQLFAQLKKTSGIARIHPHLLRHTFATNYLVDGGNLEELRILMGHTDIQMTQKYVHLAEQQKVLRNRFVSHIDKFIS